MGILNARIADFLEAGQHETEPPAPNFDAIFADPPRKRHKWGAEKFGGSFVRHDCVSICVGCGMECHRRCWKAGL